MTNLKENVQHFSDQIPSELRSRADEIVKSVITNGASAAPDYSFIDDSANVDAATAERQIKFLDRELGDSPSPEEEKDYKIKVSNITSKLAGKRSTPKSNTYDYISEKLIQLYRLQDGDMTSYGFEMTPAMKGNILAGLGKMFDMYDPKGIFKAFFIGGRFSKRGINKPILPRNKMGKIDWEKFNNMYLLTRQLTSNPETIQRALAAYNPDQAGSFSALFMNTASLRYKDAFRKMNSKARAGDPDAALRQDTTASTGDISTDDVYGGDGKSTVADTIADPDSISGDHELDISGGVGDAMKEIMAWIKDNMKEGDYKAELFNGAFIDGIKPTEMMADPSRYPLVAAGDNVKAKNNLNRLKTNAKFQNMFKQIVSKHIPDLANKDADLGAMSFNLNNKGSEDSLEKDVEYSDMSGDDFESDFYNESLYENILMERVTNRIKNLISESLWSKFQNC